jgi:hypothetical protein
MADEDPIKPVENRIKELGEKSSQTLLFLSFALVVVATLKDKSDSCQQIALKWAMYFWSFALFPVVLGILPLKEHKEGDLCWYTRIRWIKIWLLRVAIGLILIGGLAFTMAIRQIFTK